jgi:hypothetical protein
MINKALDCIHTHTSGNFYALEKTCKNCPSHNICHEVLLSIGSHRLTELWNKNKADIMRQHAVTNNWQSIGCTNI